MAAPKSVEKPRSTRLRGRGRVSFSLSPDERRRLGRHWSDHPGLRHMGARATIAADKVRVVVSPLAPHHRGGLGSTAVNGGVLAALFDLVLGLPGHLCLKSAPRTGTLELAMTFMRPVNGDLVVAEGWCERTTAHHAFTAAHIKDASGVVCARAHGIVASAGRGPRDIIPATRGKE